MLPAAGSMAPRREIKPNDSANATLILIMDDGACVGPS